MYLNHETFVLHLSSSYWRNRDMIRFLFSVLYFRNLHLWITTAIIEIIWLIVWLILANRRRYYNTNINTMIDREMEDPESRSLTSQSPKKLDNLIRTLADLKDTQMEREYKVCWNCMLHVYIFANLIKTMLLEVKRLIYFSSYDILLYLQALTMIPSISFGKWLKSIAL